MESLSTPRKRMRGFWWKLEQLEAGMGNLPLNSPATVATTKSGSRTPGSKRRKAGEAEAKEEVKPCALDFVPTTALCVVPLGAEMSKQRIATWTRQMENLGARIVSRYAPELAYVVVDPLVQLQKVMAWCGVGELSVNQYLVSYTWIMDCLQSKQLRDASRYVIRTEPELSLTPNPVLTTQESASSSSSGNSNMPPSAAARKRARAEPASSEDEDERAMMAAVRAVSPRVERIHSNDAALVKMREKYPWLQRASRLRTDEVESDSWVKHNKHKFACQLSGQGLTNHNKALSDVFERLETIYTMLGDSWRAYSFKKVAGLLQNWPRVIKDEHDVSKIHGIGKKMQDKIREVLETGQLQRLVEFENNPQIQTMLAFSQIWGVGATTARILWNRGYRSIEDLRTRGQADLNAQQLIGLARYEDLLQKIPRAEVEEIEAIVREAATSLVPGVQCITCGSYRRGKLFSGDVDVLIGPPLECEDVNILSEVVAKLEAAGFITDRLSYSDIHISGEPDTFMGVCKLQREGALHRRLDIKVYPRSMFAFAVLYFTGSGHFNRSMRLYASKLGYSLSDKSLCKVIRKGRDKVASGARIPCYTEEQIFECLGLEYKTPQERNCFDVSLVDDEYKEKQNGATSQGIRPTVSP